MRIHTLYDTKEVVTDQGYQMQLRYYLIQEIQRDSGITYGIRNVKDTKEQQEQEDLPALSYSMHEVECLLRQMIYGVVTPMTAAAVADDWMADRMG